MGLLDLLYERQRARVNEEEFQSLLDRREAMIRSGLYSGTDGLLACPHCGHALSEEDIAENRRRTSGLPADVNPRDFFQCPVCRRALNF
jgi:hypothetical protein